ncbi:hypothetical protein HPB51_004552 [Rhipicephalus microplus]|uniref:Uncharacterized protein n=1 Tax=Rhipicephalus microplus TaxID=6941 RepID=A0A9J6EM38_RHIMP|nr:hypothetical protein HPB51_004552 [Rhipicephalus microplus]
MMPYLRGGVATLMRRTSLRDDVKADGDDPATEEPWDPGTGVLAPPPTTTTPGDDAADDCSVDGEATDSVSVTSETVETEARPPKTSLESQSKFSSARELEYTRLSFCLHRNSATTGRDSIPRPAPRSAVEPLDQAAPARHDNVRPAAATKKQTPARQSRRRPVPNGSRTHPVDVSAAPPARTRGGKSRHEPAESDLNARMNGGDRREEAQTKASRFSLSLILLILHALERP